MPIDNGHLILQSEEEKDQFLEKEPAAKPLIRQYGGGDEAISGQWRYCLWLENVRPQTLRPLTHVRSRIKATKDFRESSSREATNRLADVPGLFGEIRQPKTRYLLIPKVSSVNREYIPISFQPSDVIANGSALISEDADEVDFAILQSKMHMVWVRNTSGAMKSDLQYSIQIVYNNFPWPDLKDSRRTKIEAASRKLLGIRDKYSDHSLEELYDPLVTPPDLVKAHRTLDREVELAFRRKRFTTDVERFAHLLERYQSITEEPGQ